MYAMRDLLESWRVPHSAWPVCVGGPLTLDTLTCTAPTCLPLRTLCLVPRNKNDSWTQSLEGQLSQPLILACRHEATESMSMRWLDSLWPAAPISSQAGWCKQRRNRWCSNDDSLRGASNGFAQFSNVGIWHLVCHVILPYATRYAVEYKHTNGSCLHDMDFQGWIGHQVLQRPGKCLLILMRNDADGFMLVDDIDVAEASFSHPRTDRKVLQISWFFDIHLSGWDLVLL